MTVERSKRRRFLTLTFMVKSVLEIYWFIADAHQRFLASNKNFHNMRRNIGSLLDRHLHASPLLSGSLRKPRRQWQRERHLTKGFNEHNNVCARC